MIKILLFVNIIIVLIWDVFRAPQSLANRVAEIVTKGKIHQIQLQKPFGCSLCITFWTSLILTYIFCERSLEGYLVATLISLVNAFATKYTYSLILLFEKCLDKIIDTINNLTND